MSPTIVDEWPDVTSPPPPELKPVTIDPAVTALLILDIQNRSCNCEKRPRCVATLPNIQALLAQARNKGMTVVYSITSRASTDDIRQEVAPLPDEPTVKAGVDKFFGTELDEILRSRNVKAVIVVGTSAHGAVLNTATGAALRGYEVIVPVDCMSADEQYPEQYTAWHLANSPGTRRQACLTQTALVTF